ncbi:MAG: hypothetical protein AAGF04_02450 [Chlamydiota bacterium]
MKKQSEGHSSQKASPTDFQDVTKPDREELTQIIHKALALIEQIEKKENANENSINKTQGQLLRAKNESEKLSHFLAVEGLKMERFTSVEEEYTSLSQLLNQAYPPCQRLGGIIQSEFSRVCDTLSQGIHLDAIKKGLERMQKDLTSKNS